MTSQYREARFRACPSGCGLAWIPLLGSRLVQDAQRWFAVAALLRETLSGAKAQGCQKTEKEPQDHAQGQDAKILASGANERLDLLRGLSMGVSMGSVASVWLS